MSWVISPARNTRPSGLYGLQKISSCPPARNAASIPSRSNVKKPVPSSSIGTWMISRPRNFGTIRNGMYAGVGRMTGEPGREKCVMASSSPLITSGIGWMSAGSACHPYRRAMNSAQAAASSSASGGGR